MSPWKLIFLTSASLLVAPAIGVFTARAVAELPELERAFVRQAPAVLRHLKDKRYRNVGVLKFLVVKGNGRMNDNVGTLNTTLAQRLEVALLLANDVRQPLGIVSGASTVAQRTPGANHLSRSGRLRLFEPRYPLAWGKQTVEVDAFVTGIARVSADLRTMTISLLGFDKEENSLGQILPNFQAANRADYLGEMGESFVLRGGFDDGEISPVAKQAKALQTASEVKETKYPSPAADRFAPTRLRIFYDEKRVPLKLHKGKVYVAEPRQGQKVTFVVERDNSEQRYGVVLKVNGQNTLEKQRLPDLSCRKWILDPTDKTLTVRGFQIDQDTREQFRVLSAPESKAREIHYGADVGTVTLTVFKETSAQSPPPDLSEEAAEASVVAKAKLPEKVPDTYDALKSNLLEEANRGLIVEGQHVAGKVKRVRFDADPTPIMTLTVTYYRR